MELYGYFWVLLYTNVRFLLHISPECGKKPFRRTGERLKAFLKPDAPKRGQMRILVIKGPIRGDTHEPQTEKRGMGQNGSHVWYHGIFNLLLPSSSCFAGRRPSADSCGVLLMEMLSHPQNKTGRLEGEAA